MEGVFLKDYPPEAFTIKCLEVGTLLNFIILHHHHSLNVPRTRLLSWQRKAVNSGLRSISNPGWRRSRQWYIARKALLSSIRSCSLKVSNWEGRLTTWDRRSTINCTMEDLLLWLVWALTDQDEIEYWKIRMCRLTLLVEQVTMELISCCWEYFKDDSPPAQLSSQQTKMTSVTLRAGNSKLMKLWVDCEVNPKLKIIN